MPTAWNRSQLAWKKEGRCPVVPDSSQLSVLASTAGNLTSWRRAAFRRFDRLPHVCPHPPSLNRARLKADPFYLYPRPNPLDL